MNNRARTIRRMLVLVVIVAVFFVIWKFSTRTPSVTVTLPKGTDRAELVSAADDNVIRTSGKEPISLAGGTYFVTYFKGGQAVATQTAKIGKNSGRSITIQLTAATDKLSTVLHARTDKLTPLGDGYLYIDRQTRGITYASTSGIQDVSAQFELSASQTDLDFTTYNTVINIEQGRSGEAIVTTTTAVFVVKNMTDITKLPSATTDFLNFTSSSYDAVSNRVFLLSSYKRVVYYYDLGKPEQGPQTFYTNRLDVNRIVAGGGSVILYFDDFPSLEPDTLDAYGLTRQTAPVVFNSDSGKPVRTLDQYKGATQITISPSGKYMAVKKKFGVTMTMSKLTGDDPHTVLAPDTNGLAWVDDDLYVGRGQALWVLKPGQLDKPVLMATGKAPLRQVVASNKTLYVSDTTNFTYKTVSASTDTTAQLGDKLKKLNLDTDDFYISFVDVHNQGAGVIQTKGTFALGDDEGAVKAVEAQQLQRASAALGEFANSPSISFSHEDGSIIRQYQYAAIPADE